ncbi:MAG: hypothetical protein ACYC1C_13495 [Chloroflexota bacterium]
MSLLAMATPILPGKTEEWRRFAEELRGSRYREYAASRRRLGVRERVFFQSTPNGDMAIVTLEGDDPVRAFQQLGVGNDDFTRWFVQRVKEIHGLDLTQPLAVPLPELLVDTQAGGVSQM